MLPSRRERQASIQASNVQTSAATQGLDGALKAESGGGHGNHDTSPPLQFAFTYGDDAPVLIGKNKPPPPPPPVVARRPSIAAPGSVGGAAAQTDKAPEGAARRKSVARRRGSVSVTIAEFPVQEADEGGIPSKSQNEQGRPPISSEPPASAANPIEEKLEKEEREPNASTTTGFTVPAMPKPSVSSAGALPSLSMEAPSERDMMMLWTEWDEIAREVIGTIAGSPSSDVAPTAASAARNVSAGADADSVGITRPHGDDDFSQYLSATPPNMSNDVDHFPKVYAEARRLIAVLMDRLKAMRENHAAVQAQFQQRESTLVKKVKDQEDRIKDLGKCQQCTSMRAQLAKETARAAEAQREHDFLRGQKLRLYDTGMALKARVRSLEKEMEMYKRDRIAFVRGDRRITKYGVLPGIAVGETLTL